MSSCAGQRPTDVPGPDKATTVVIVYGEVEVASWPWDAMTPPDLSAVDELCRLGVAARRLGCAVRLRDAPCELWALLELVGLDGVVSRAGELVVEVGGQPEQGEEIGVEEGVEPGDPAI
jgi:hypothetical protein